MDHQDTSTAHVFESADHHTLTSSSPSGSGPAVLSPVGGDDAELIAQAKLVEQLSDEDNTTWLRDPDLPDDHPEEIRWHEEARGASARMRTNIDKLAAMPATTAAGIAAKGAATLKMNAMFEHMDWPEEARLVRGLAEDAVRLGSRPVANVAEIIEPDQIYAFIERHRAADAAFVAAVDLDDGNGPEVEQACVASREARYDMHQAVPQTIAGLVAYVSYWMEHIGPWEDSPSHGLLSEEGWEAVPTIAEALGNLFPQYGQATDQICNPEEAAQIDFQPWDAERSRMLNAEEWNREFDVRGDHASNLQIACSLLIKTKPELVGFVRQLDPGEAGALTATDLYDSLKQTADFLKCLSEYADVASTRLLIAAASANDQTQAVAA